MPHTQHLRSALFVDFDNIFINLQQIDSRYAVEFASSPDNWLRWLEAEMPSVNLDHETTARRILIRRCYLNPNSFSSYRPYFIRSAFEVVDCPPLTSRGKTSTDIHMVMDILDALGHATRIDEFIVLSGDADFTPVLLRLRQHDRLSAVLAPGYASPAYKAACDYLIQPDSFIRQALGFTAQEEEPISRPPQRDATMAPANLLERMAARLAEVANVPGGIEASELPAVYKEFNEFRESNHWLGYFSLRRLTEALVSLQPGLDVVEEDPWRVAVVAPPPAPPEAAPAEPTAEPGQPEQSHAPGENGAAPAAHSEPEQRLPDELARYIHQVVNSSKTAVPMASLAQAVSREFGSELAHTGWLGAGTFKELLAELALDGLATSFVNPGYVYNPALHEPPESAGSLGVEPAERADLFAARYPELADLAQKVHRLTDTPYLLPEHYALLLHELAREINEHGYQMTRTSKTVRDRCVERGAPIARSHINFVLIGLSYAGHRFDNKLEQRPDQMAEVLLANTLNLCRAAQMNLTEDETQQLRQWITGGLKPEA
ncbi:MAG: NYN domain-containing protein [Anaerolineales bacterium]|nr:NYN domain-containing protein [Anaerolineales bacterium]